MNFSRVKISTTVPTTHAEKVREAVGKAGAGKIGEYSYCSFSVTGYGRFKPSLQADPTIGEPGKLETVKEEYIMIECTRKVAKQVVEALKKAHPYEEVIVDIVPLLEVDEI